MYTMYYINVKIFVVKASTETRVINWSHPTPYSRVGSVSIAAHRPLQSAITTHIFIVAITTAVQSHILPVSALKCEYVINLQRKSTSSWLNLVSFCNNTELPSRMQGISNVVEVTYTKPKTS